MISAGISIPPAATVRKWTLRRAFEQLYLPGSKLKPTTVADYKLTLKTWERLTGNPPIGSITQEVCERFAAAYLKEGRSRLVLQRDWYKIAAILGRLAIRNNSNRRGLGLLERIPKLRPETFREQPPDLRIRPPDPQGFTLYEAYWRFYRPDLMIDRSARTVQAYETSLCYWEQLTDDPPLKSINNQTLDRFKAALVAHGLGPVSVNRVLRHLKAIFRRIGPAETRNPGGLGILYHVPYTRALRQPAKIPRVLTVAQLAAIFDACDVATWPLSDKSGLAPEVFWRATLTLAYNLGLARDDLFSLRAEAVDLNAGFVTVVRGKTGRILRLPINASVDKVLRVLMQPGRERLLYQTKSNRQLYRQFHAIQKAAGIAKPYFGFHDLRRTCATELERLAPGAGTFMLGHSNPAVTWRHYRNPTEAVHKAALALPQPNGNVSERRLASDSD